jgi:mercuric ion binding protein
MWRSPFEEYVETHIMRTNTDRGRPPLHTLAIGVVVVMALGLAASAFGAAAQAPAGDRNQAVVTVRGMQCPFCAYGIKKHLAKLTGATRVDVELAKNQAIVTFAPGAKATDAQIQQAVRNAGFTAGAIERRAGTPGDGR